jgi:predicted nicotinamide N-methyase
MVRLLGHYDYYFDVFFLLVLFVWYVDTAYNTTTIAIAALGPIGVAFHHPRSHHRSSSSSSSNTFVPNCCQWHRYRQPCPTISYSPIHHDDDDTTHHCPDDDDDDAARVSAVVMVPTLYGLLECVPIPIPIVVPSADHFLPNHITTTTTTTMVVTIVEASAPTQNHLVDLALSNDDDDDVVLLPSVPAAVVATTTTIPDDDNDSLTTHDALTMGTITTTTSATKVQDPYGSVLWPAASAVATYLMTTVVPTMLVCGGTDSDARRRRHVHVLELGCGTGLVSMTVAVAYQEAMIRRQQEQRERELSATTNLNTTRPKMAALSILATDYELLPLQLVQYAAQHYNHIPMTQQQEELDTTTCDERPIVLQTMLLDICNLSQPLPLQPPSEERYNLVVAADLLYDTTTAVALAHRIVEAIRYYNATVIVGDSPGRVGRPVFLQELIRCGIQNPTFTTTSMGQKIDTRQQPRHELICGVNSTSVVQPWNHLEGSPITGTPPTSPESWLPIDILHLDGSSLVVWR